MYISFKNLELPESYSPDPMNPSNIMEDIAYVKQRMGGFKELVGVDFIGHEYYDEWIFDDKILPKEIAISHKNVPLLTKVNKVRNIEKYEIRKYRVVVSAGNYVSRVYVDIKRHPHATDLGEYCIPKIVAEGKFSSFRFEKLRVSFFRWNLTRCYADHRPQERDFELTPIFQDGG